MKEHPSSVVTIPAPLRKTRQKSPDPLTATTIRLSPRDRATLNWLQVTDAARSKTRKAPSLSMTISAALELARMALLNAPLRAA